jgi:hypothetical protein
MPGNDKILRAASEAGLESAAAEAILQHGRGDGARSANARFYLAVLGVLPWVGVLISAVLARWAEQEQQGLNEMHRRWLEEHEARLEELRGTVHQIEARVASFGHEAQGRLNSDAYLALVRKGFRVWDSSESADKRDLIRKVLTNAAGSRDAPDDFIRRFIEWIDSYNELHFQVVRCIYKNPHITRQGIWDEIRGTDVTEDSAEADLFKLLIRDLSTGSVIRQHREKDAAGNFLKKRPRRHVRGGTRVMKSAFDDEEEYVLTELGQAFVSYALNEVVLRLPDAGPPSPLSSS